MCVGPPGRSAAPKLSASRSRWDTSGVFRGVLSLGVGHPWHNVAVAPTGLGKSCGKSAPPGRARSVLKRARMNGALAMAEPRSRDAKASAVAPKILIADDDRDMCELAEAGLSQRGYGVSWRLSP